MTSLTDLDHQTQQAVNCLPYEPNDSICLSPKTGFELLPVEIQHRIFEQLPFQDCVRASNVSRAWHNHALRRPGLWRCIAFDNCSTMTTKNLRTYCQRKCIQPQYVRELLFTNAIGNQLPELLKFTIEQRWTNIEKGNCGARIQYWNSVN